MSVASLMRVVCIEVIFIFRLVRSHEGLPSHAALALPAMIPLEHLGLFVEIASGNFGKVYRAVYQNCLVVVKIPKEANLKVLILLECVCLTSRFSSISRCVDM